MKYLIRHGSGTLIVEADRIVPNSEAKLLFFLAGLPGGTEEVKAIIPFDVLRMVKQLQPDEPDDNPATPAPIE